jgi:parallel beta-helix repeat protein
MTRRQFLSPRLIAASAVSILAGLGFVFATEVTTSSASSTCTYYASPGGSDGNNGSSSAPFATVQKLADSLSAGQTGCLTSGRFVGDVSLRHGGRSGSPITFTSADTSHPATVVGRIATFPGGDWITFTQLYLDGVNSGKLPSPTVGSDHVTFQNVDVTNDHTSICFDIIDSNWGTAHYTTIDSSKVHDCGVLPAQNGDHGIYVSAYNTRITNNYIYDNADRGVQLRGAQSTVVQNNVIDGNGEGVIFGDLTTNNNDVSNNIVANSHVRWNAESFWGSGPVGSGNSFHDNCTWGSNSNSYYNGNGGVDSPQGFSASSNAAGKPAYANASHGDYRLQSGSPCAGKGPQATSIGVVAGATTSAPATTPSTTTSAPSTTPTSTPTTTTGTPLAPPADGPTPVNTGLPLVSGAARPGSRLTASTGTWANATSVSYWWLRCDRSGTNCKPMTATNASTYTIMWSDRSSTIRVIVIGRNDAGSTSATSAATDPIKRGH